MNRHFPSIAEVILQLDNQVEQAGHRSMVDQMIRQVVA